MFHAQVIIAEDEAELRSLIAELLSERGLKVKQAPDGTKALQLLEAARGTALLLSDVRMPGMSGYTLVEAALEMQPELKVLMMTGYPGDQPTPAALRAREIRTLIKPFDLERMCDLVLEMLARP